MQSALTLPNHHRPTSVMFVDDVPFNAALYERVLKPLGCEVTVANNFFEAFVQLNFKLPDIIVFNHETINGTCNDFCQVLKTNPVLRSIPLVAMIHNKDEAVVQ